MGTLLGVYIATSDESLPILLANPDKIGTVLPLLAVKFCVGLVVGYGVDLIITKGYKKEEEPLPIADKKEEEEIIHRGCCHHEIQSENKWKQYLLHPLLHSLKIFLYILAINILFGIVIYFVGEERLLQFLQLNKYFAPVLAVLVGLIPNCVSSVILTDLFVMGGLGFGATVSGLSVNAGLGLLVLFKKKSELKNNLIILGVLVAVSLTVGYTISAIQGF